MTEQEMFEEWANEKKMMLGKCIDGGDAFYRSANTRTAWEAWQARAAMESKPVKSCGTCTGNGGQSLFPSQCTGCGDAYDNYKPIESKPVAPISLCETCYNDCKKLGVSVCTNFIKSKPESAIDRLRKVVESNPDMLIVEQIAILELDARLKEMGK